MKIKPFGTYWVAIFVVIFSGLFSSAGSFPTFSRQIPKELHGEYRLLMQMNPDKTHQEFTNAPLFGTFSSNRIVLANGNVRSLNLLIHVSQNGTNVYLMSFSDKSTWLATRNPSPPGLAVIEPEKTNSKVGTMFIIVPQAANTTIQQK